MYMAALIYTDGTSDTTDPAHMIPVFEEIGSVVCEITEPQQDGSPNQNRLVAVRNLHYLHGNRNTGSTFCNYCCSSF